MKAIHIDPKNKDKLEAALLEMNGSATAHTYHSVHDLVAVAKHAEEYLDTHGPINKGHRPGAQAVYTSGEKLANSYKYSAIRTQITLERRTNNRWFLIDVTRVEQLYSPRYRLPAKTLDHMIQNIRKLYYFMD